MSTTKTTVIIDCQLFQNSDRLRGMGMYLASILAHYEPAEGTSFVFVTNSKLKDVSKADRALLERLGGEFVSEAFATKQDSADFAEVSERNRKLLDKLLRPYLKNQAGGHKAAFFIPAMFSYEIYPVFPSEGTANLTLFHDLIPYLYSEHYFADHGGEPRRDYAQRFREVYRTDLFIANSQTTADDLTSYFGVDPSRIVAILGGAASRSRLTPKRPAAISAKEKFIFMPSGNDYRKNNLRAVAAYAALNGNVKLVIPSPFNAESQKQLLAISPNLVFVGTVSDEEFLWLFDNAHLVFFPSEYEGLGMPLLEAMERNALIAASRIPVFEEITPDGVLYFDPTSVEDMKNVLAEGIGSAEAGGKVTSARKKQYEQILDRFSWQNTAALFGRAIELAEPNTVVRPKLAILGPSPTSYSAVGKYLFQVHAELVRHFDIDYFIEDGLTPHNRTRPNILEYAANYFPAVTFHSRKDSYDKVLYHIGNSEFHIETILESLRTPATAIVHDTMVNGIFDYMVNRGFMAPERRELELRLDHASKTKKSRNLTSIATNQALLFCHSRYVAGALKETIGTAPKPIIAKVQHPIGVPLISTKAGDKTVVSFAGIISEDKGLKLVTEISRIPGVTVRVFGFGVLGDSPLLNGLQNVEVIKDLSDKAFQDALTQTDVLVNYRPNYHGETSRSALEAMARGAVVIVKDIGWYSELPDDIVVKVGGEVDVLEAVRRLAENPKQRAAIAQAARQHLQQKYTYGEYATAIAAHING